VTRDQPTVNVAIYHSPGLHEATLAVRDTLRALSHAVASDVVYRPFIWPRRPPLQHACVCLLWHDLPVVLSGWYWPNEWWRFEQPSVLVFFQERPRFTDEAARSRHWYVESAQARVFFDKVLGLSTTRRPSGSSVGSGASFEKPLVEYLAASKRKVRRGFASMSPERQREIASKGGRAAHQKGTAHEWSADEARQPGRKGGMASARRRASSSGQETRSGREVVPGSEEIDGLESEVIISVEHDVSASLSRAHFAAFAPDTVEPGRPFLLEVWVASANRYEEMLRMAGRDTGISQRGSKLTAVPSLGSTFDVAVNLPSFRVEEATDTLLWAGEPTNASFVMTPEPDIAAGWHVGTATIMLSGVPLARLRFRIQVGRSMSDARQVSTDEQRVESIFASYASADRVDVLQWARGAAHLGRLRVFLDVLSLREGADWDTQLLKVIPASDLFCLFWSASAKQSAWVDKEWRCALAARGLDYIHPVPLQDPRDVPPPSELTARHFGDPIFFVQLYERFRLAQRDSRGS